MPGSRGTPHRRRPDHREAQRTRRRPPRPLPLRGRTAARSSLTSVVPSGVPRRTPPAGTTGFRSCPRTPKPPRNEVGAKGLPRPRARSAGDRDEERARTRLRPDRPRRSTGSTPKSGAARPDGDSRFPEVAGRRATPKALPLTRNEIRTAPSRPDDDLLAPVPLRGGRQSDESAGIRRPFGAHPDDARHQPVRPDFEVAHPRRSALVTRPARWASRGLAPGAREIVTANG